jgi:transposase
MSKSGKKVYQTKQRRIFSEAFKRQKVQQIVDKQISIKDVSDLYQVSKMSVYRWLYQYSPHHARGTNQVVQMESEAHKTKALLQKVAQLEQVVGQKQLQIDYLNKLLELASESFKTDIKKNFGSPPLNGSDPIVKPSPTP